MSENFISYTDLLYYIIGAVFWTTVLFIIVIFLWRNKDWLRSQRNIICWFTKIDNPQVYNPRKIRIHEITEDKKRSATDNPIYRWRCSLLKDNMMVEEYFETRSYLQLIDIDQALITMGNCNMNLITPNWINNTINFIKITPVIMDSRPVDIASRAPWDPLIFLKYFGFLLIPIIIGFLGFFWPPLYFSFCFLPVIGFWIHKALIIKVESRKSDYWLHKSFPDKIFTFLVDAKYLEKENEESEIVKRTKEEISIGEAFAIMNKPTTVKGSFKMDFSLDEKEEYKILEEEVDYQKFRELEYDYWIKCSELLYDIGNYNTRAKNATDERLKTKANEALLIYNNQIERNNDINRNLEMVKLSQFKTDEIAAKIFHTEGIDNIIDIEIQKRNASKEAISSINNDKVIKRLEAWERELSNDSRNG